MVNFSLEWVGKVLESENGVAIAGITGITGIVGAHYLAKHRYKVNAKHGDNSVTIAPATEEEPEPMPEQKPKSKPRTTKKNQAK